MSMLILKAGLHDTFQDGGRKGWQHVGINVGGAMDLASMQVANIVVGNKPDEGVLEFTFPAPVIQFNQAALLVVGGADFEAKLNNAHLVGCKPFVVAAGTVLSFATWKQGAYAYLAVHGGYELDDWLASTSTHTKVKAGGFNGRRLLKGDVINFKRKAREVNTLRIFPWYADVRQFMQESDTIRCVTGIEWLWLNKSAQKDFCKIKFVVSKQSDRMGYRLLGKALLKSKNEELPSAAVNFGTVQLLPDGQLIILMADHQTTGGYPRIAHVASADRSRLAQRAIGASLYFSVVSHQEAEMYFMQQVTHIEQLAFSISFRLKDVISELYEQSDN